MVKRHPDLHLHREREGGEESHRKTERTSVKASTTNDVRLTKIVFSDKKRGLLGNIHSLKLFRLSLLRSGEAPWHFSMAGTKALTVLGICSMDYWPSRGTSRRVAISPLEIAF